MTLHTSEAPRCMCVTCSNCRKYSFSNTTSQTRCVYDWTTVKTITWQRRTKKQNQQDILLTRHRQILTPPQNWPTPYSIRESRNEVTYQLLVGWLVDSHFKWPEVINIILDKYYSHWQSVLSTTDTIHFSFSRIGLQESGNWIYPLPPIPSPTEWTGW